MNPLNRRILLKSFGAGLLGVANVRDAFASSQPNNASDESAALAALVGPSTSNSHRITAFRTEGGTEITLDRSMLGFALLKAADDNEIWALRSTFGARGDEMLSNDIGQVMLRVNNIGAATYYRLGDTVGRAASARDGGQALGRPSANGRSLQTVVEQALAQCDRIAPGEVRLEAEGGLPPGLVADAYRNVIRALTQFPSAWHTSNARRVRRFRVRLGDEVGVQKVRQLLLINVVPNLGYAGRPSSALIRNILRGA